MSDVQRVMERHQADERIRLAQQGRGRPILSWQVGDHRLVAVGNAVHFSRAWKTFPDFLAAYVKRILDPEWGNAELAKPFDERHPIIQWYHAFCLYQHETIKTPGVPATAEMNGVTACFLGMAYSLYLLDHNVELQNLLVGRLKNPGTFQGAYYELIVANTLIRAGFTLTLEDETDSGSKHCEFAAVSKTTGKKYWVEAKMRAVTGLLGRTEKDGTSKANPISSLIPQLNDALKKPAADERLIFIDLNTDASLAPDGKPAWAKRALERLDRYEAKELPAGVTAFLFVTNLPVHRMLKEHPVISAVSLGLGIPDFSKPGYYRLSEVWRRRQRHIDAHNIADALGKYPQLPTTFDGGLPSESFGRRSNRLIIGETYFFESIGEGGTVGTVTTVSVSEEQKAIYFGMTDQNGLTRLRGLAAQECDFECCASKQAIELMGLVLARIAGMGCSEDLPYSLGRVSASRFVPSCFCGRPDGTRTARRTSIGTSSRIGVSTMAGWCSDKFCIWERSIRRRPPLGVKRSRYSTRRPELRER